MRRAPHLVLAVLALALAGCRGKLVSTAELHAPGTATTRFHVFAGQKLRLWADTEGTWVGSKSSHFPVTYTVDLQQGGKSLGRIQCDTRQSGTAVCGSSSNIFGEHSANCEYELGCTLPPLAAGEVVLHVEGHLPEPGRVKKVGLMSLVVREE
jgi:hypothetical protein